MRRRERIAFALKLAITLGLLAYLLRTVEIAPAIAHMRALAPAAAVGAVLLLLVQLGLMAWRWQLVNRIVEAPMRPGQVLRLTLVGHFFNQVLPSGFAGDAARAWLAAREGVRPGPLVRAILVDRVVGLLALVAMVAASAVVLPEVAPGRLPPDHPFGILAELGLAGLAALFVLGVPVARVLLRHRLTAALGRFLEDLHRVSFRARGTSAAITVLAVAVQVLNVAAVWLCARGMRIDLDFGAALVVVPTVMLVALVPVSFAGWGMRESAMIVALGLLGIAASGALAVSIVFGCVQAALGVPGAALWLARRGTATPAEALRPEEPR